jgi:hypothetical protein
VRSWIPRRREEGLPLQSPRRPSQEAGRGIPVPSREKGLKVSVGVDVSLAREVARDETKASEQTRTETESGLARPTGRLKYPRVNAHREAAQFNEIVSARPARPA